MVAWQLDEEYLEGQVFLGEFQGFMLDAFASRTQLMKCIYSFVLVIYILVITVQLINSSSNGSSLALLVTWFLYIWEVEIYVLLDVKF